MLFENVYYKLRQGDITDLRQPTLLRTATRCYYELQPSLLQIATGITNCDECSVIINCDFTTNCDSKNHSRW